jgi:hypothetical protein
MRIRKRRKRRSRTGGKERDRWRREMRGSEGAERTYARTEAKRGRRRR